MIHEPKGQFDLIFDQYSKALELWKKTFEAWKTAGEEAFKQYLQGMQFAYTQSNQDLLNQYAQMWQNAWKNSSFENINSMYMKVWDDLWKSSGFPTFQKFNEYWQDVMKNSNNPFFPKPTKNQ